MNYSMNLAIHFRFIRRFFLLNFFVLNVLAVHAQTLVNRQKSTGDTEIRIMPLGNSITFGEEAGLEDVGQMKSYRQKLWQLLKDNGYRVDFVGSEISGQDVTPSFDVDNAGFSGILKGELLSLVKSGVNPRNDEVLTEGPYLDAFSPDIILLHIGTNSPTPGIEEIDQLLNEVDAYEARAGISATVIVARIIKRLPKNDGDINVQNLAEYNKNLAALIEERKGSDKVVLVDMENGAGITYEIGVDMSDRLHPNENGYEKMAEAWFDPLVSVLGSRPAAPSDLTAVAISETSIELNWVDNSDNEGEIVLERSASPDSGFSLLEQLPSDAVSFTDEGLEPGQTAYYRLKAVNSFRESGYSNTASATTVNNELTSPGELKANAVSNMAIEVQWTDNTDSENGFILESAATEDGEFAELIRLQADTDHYLHEGISPGTTVFYRVKAIRGEAASAYSNIAGATTLVTGVDEDKFSKSLTIYPNPAHDIVSVDMTNKKLGLLTVRVINLAGLELLDFSTEKTGPALKARLDVSRLPQGMYIMEITCDRVRTTRLLSVQ